MNSIKNIYRQIDFLQMKINKLENVKFTVRDNHDKEHIKSYIISMRPQLTTGKKAKFHALYLSEKKNENDVLGINSTQLIEMKMKDVLITFYIEIECLNNLSQTESFYIGVKSHESNKYRIITGACYDFKNNSKNKINLCGCTLYTPLQNDKLCLLTSTLDLVVSSKSVLKIKYF